MPHEVAGPSHWVSWHAPYDDPNSPLSRRLVAVQRAIRDWLDVARAGQLGIISCCAGQGRDVVGALDGHPRAIDVRARLVEADPGNAVVAQQLIEGARLSSAVQVVCGDASVTGAFDGAVPADLALMCGIFGNISEADIQRTLDVLPTLCAAGASVIWTRHRRAPDRTGDIRRWLEIAGFEEVSWCAPDDALYSVGMHRLVAEPQRFDPAVRMFDFVGDGARPA